MAGAGPPQLGYPTELVVDALDSRYLCSSCKLLLRQPTQSLCGHRFCKECANKLIREQPSGKAPCPVCLEDGTYDDEPEECTLSSDKIYPDNALNRDLRKLQVKCLNPGCEWTGRFSKYEDHLLACKWSPVACLCGQHVSQEDMDSHELTECPLRKVSCPNCKKAVVYRDIQEHVDSCPSKTSASREESLQALSRSLTLCPFDCGVSLSSIEEQVAHYAEAHKEHTTRLLRMIRALEAARDRRMPTSEPPSLEPATQVVAPPPVVAPPRVVAPTVAPMTGGGPDLTEELKQLEDTVEVLVEEVHRDETAIKTLERQLNQAKEAQETADNKIRNLERSITLKDISIAELELRVQYLENTNYHGNLTWRLPDFSRKRHEAISGKTTSIYSPTFHTSRTGYKMCARIYLNGDGIGKGSHVSLFFVLLRGTYDALLPWPFRQKVTFKFIDQNQKDHVIDAFRPDPTSTSFKRPTSEMNIASGCPLFMPLAQLDSPQHGFIKDNTAYIHISVDLTGLENY